MIILVLIVAGLVLGSFVNALVYRLHMQDKAGDKSDAKGSRQTVGGKNVDLSIAKGRSVCVHCGHELAWKDLVPVLSWLLLKGKCRYCHKPISWQYPAVELATAMLFVLSSVFWPEPLIFDVKTLVYFVGWLIILTGFVALTVYDIRWMLLPDKIVFPLMIMASLLVALEVVLSGSQVLTQTGLSVIIAGGVFFLLFQISGGRWIGGGDVKLGALIGLVLRDPFQAFAMLLLASMLGTIFILPGLLLGKITAKSHIPFGPFLIVAAVLVFLFGPTFLDWYRETILLY